MSDVRGGSLRLHDLAREHRTNQCTAQAIELGTSNSTYLDSGVMNDAGAGARICKLSLLQNQQRLR